MAAVAQLSQKEWLFYSNRRRVIALAIIRYHDIIIPTVINIPERRYVFPPVILLVAYRINVL